MNFQNRRHKSQRPRMTVSIAVAGVCAAAFSGCLPLPPLVTTPKLALYYQQSSSTPADDKAWIKRWLPDTNATDVVLQQKGSNSGLGNFWPQSLQPGGSNLMLFRLIPPSSLYYVTVPDSSDRQPRLLYTSTSRDDASIVGGIWISWAPDGKHIGMQINDEVIVTEPDGSGKRTIGNIDGIESPYLANVAWSPDGSQLAYTRDDNILEVTDVITGVKTPLNTGAGSSMSSRPRWLHDNRHIIVNVSTGDEFRTVIFDVQNPESVQDAFTQTDCCVDFDAVWSPQGDRAIRINYVFGDPAAEYQLVFADNRSNVSLATAAVADGENERQLLPAWSHDGERLAYIKDADNDGDADVIIASKDGVALQTFNDFGTVGDATLGWSPDDSRLLVVTNVVASHGGTTHGALITLAGGTVDALFATAADAQALVAYADWSPNSRYVVYRYGIYAGNPAINANGLLFDTEDLDADGLTLTVNNVAWSFDSNYLGIVTLQQNGAGDCALSVMAMSDNSVAPLAQNTTCYMAWSTPQTP
jgi:Tol biopolymer transport system component